ncbi:hypothetical protein B566_EDAN012484 [Ephemera danica]|nr:hypothetical protein B566_EDAN012484 [Ephemera danica]
MRSAALVVFCSLLLLLQVDGAPQAEVVTSATTPAPNLCSGRCVTQQFCNDVKSGRLADDTCAFVPSLCRPRACVDDEICCT